MSKSYQKVISVNSLGQITSFNIPQLPTENQKVVREKAKPISNEYRQLSKNIAEKVKKFRQEKEIKRQEELNKRANA